MRTSPRPPGRRKHPTWRIWTLSLGAVVLALAGTTVAVQSASARQPSHHNRTPHSRPHTSARPTTSATPTSTASPSVAPTATATTTTASPTQTTSPAATTPGATTAPVAGACARKSSATAEVKVTDVKLPTTVKGYGGESDTEVLPVAIASTPGGTSWLAWVGTDEKVHLGQLDCEDQLVGTPVTYDGFDLQDVQADSKGGVLLITRKGDCGTGPLCGGESSPCNTMHMIRFDTTGQQVWDQQVTNLTDSRKGYSDGARFVWWYQHHGRLAYDGTNYAAYFGVAITVKNGSCVDIHEGDRMQVVNATTGNLVSGKGFEVGCSHAWTSRIVYDPAKKDFVTVCATDNDCRIAQPNPYRTVAASTCDGTLFGGDLVLADTGYWTAWSQGGTAKLSHFTTGAADKTVQPGASTQHPHLVTYGTDRMLLSWGSGSSTQAQILNRSTGAAIGSPLTLAVKDHNYTAFKAYEDGSVAYPAEGSTTSSIKVARVMPMS
ncbi:hypothetical protein [Kineosporia mesophila]|uniref:hypothetical protein n=1 Tax=Kineosporia mesophila TaxID=566012 RepID=UPI001E460B4F|nr:hypothetical protein [Kineosporia mesophila]MCD5348938.1 hypothetical protein [Kineosporia mesophila]